MDQCEDKEEGLHSSKTFLCGKHERQPGTQSYKTRPEPKPSYVSLKSSQSYEWQTDFKQRHSPDSDIHQKPNLSGRFTSELSDGYTVAERFDEESSEVPKCQSAKMQLDSIFLLLEDTIVTFIKKELKKIQKIVSPDYQECFENQRKEQEVSADEDEDQQRSSEAFLKIVLHFLRRMDHEELAECLQTRIPAGDCQRKLKSNLKKRFQCVFEGIAKAGKPVLLNQIYTDLHITEGGKTDETDQHEVRQIETASRKPDRTEAGIRQEDIFKSLSERGEPIRTVLTKGVAGIGKTVLTHKFTLDWAEDKINKNIQFIFPFTFRELNVMKEKKNSLVELVHEFFTETKEAGICRFDEFQTVFIFDGLDESRLSLDFHNTEILTDATKSTSVDVILTNLIRRDLLPSAHLWITTRPAAADQIPPRCVDMVTEVRGFTDPQKEEYFSKRFSPEEHANKIISHIKASKNLHVMCQIPVFCWITASVLENVLKPGKKTLPKTVTEMYIHFLVIQLKMKKVKYDGGLETDSHWSPETRKMIVSLAKLAFEQMQKGNAIFYESDLTECDIDSKAASVYSGVFTQIFKEERGLYQERMFSFVHLSVQEFLAALHVHLTFINSGVNLLEEQCKVSQKSETRKDESSETDIYQSAVDKAIQSPYGHLDLFLRFLVGLSLHTNQTLLKGLLRQIEGISKINQETGQYIRTQISGNLSAEKTINLFHCLNELNDCSLVEEIQRFLNSGSLSTDKLSPAQWSALAFIVLSSEEDLDVFDLKQYFASEEALLRLLPVVKASKRAVLCLCNLSERSCEALGSVLNSQSSNLKELDLSDNSLHDSGVNVLSVGLGSPICTLETLRMSGCDVSERSCESLAMAISSPSSSLRELDLSNNNLQDSGVELLSAGLKNPHCRLESLGLSGCLVTEKGCISLASAISLNPSHLRELDLNYNHPGDTGVKLLSDGLKDNKWKLDTLRVEHAGVRWLRPGLKKYYCDLAVDTNTVNQNLKVSENKRKVIHVKELQLYPDHPDRFDHCPQLLCGAGLTGRCYWEVEWKGRVHISVNYRCVKRKGDSDECEFGMNDSSWSLFCCDGIYSVYHNNKGISVRLHSFLSSSPSSSPVPNRVAVYVDCAAGTLSFYKVASDSLTHIHTFSSTFTEPIYPGFRLWSGSSLTLCSV
ncbi:NLR family CARD domain-containing protein 3-like isoform 2-T2 [Pholidichthys leucotaenia]